MSTRLPLCAALVLCALCTTSCSSAPPPERIVLIVIDTLRRDYVGAYGGSVATPHIDRLAERGQRFDLMSAAFHQTSMSMGSLFTGRTPSIESRDAKQTLGWNGTTWCGLSRFATPGADEACVPDALPTLAEDLRAAGYWTAGIASSEFLYRPSGFDAGFDEWVELGREGGNWEAARIAVPDPGTGAAEPRGVIRDYPLVPGTRVNAAVRDVLRDRPGDRFYLYVHYMDVHDYEFRRIPYAAAVARADAAVGELVADLEAARLLEGTTIVLTSDHGERLREEHPLKGGALHLGNPSFEEVLAVPLVVAPAAPVLSGRERRAVRTQDLRGWIGEIAGLPAGETADTPPGELFVGEVHFRTFRKGRFKSAMRRSDGHFYLFDLETDPGEARDVADAHPDIVRAHLVRTSELARGMRTTHETREGLTGRERERLRLLGYIE